MIFKTFQGITSKYICNSLIIALSWQSPKQIALKTNQITKFPIGYPKPSAIKDN